MGQVIDLWAELRGAEPAARPPLCRCPVCGADLWHICEDGEVCCADCDTPCPYRLQCREQG